MPIKKYNTFSDAAKDLWVLNPDAKYYNNLKNHFEFWSKLTDAKQTKGLQKFNSYKEFLEYKNKFYKISSNP